MDIKTQIVTQLVAASLFDKEKMDYLIGYCEPDQQYKPDWVLAIQYASMVADEIINQTTPEIAFPERVV
jgi:hypothetical protein